MEGHPRKPRVVAKSEREREEWTRYMHDAFAHESEESKRPHEREKTPEEMEIIAIVNRATNDILKKYGVPDFTIPAKNIHLLHSEDTERSSGASYIATRQEILIQPVLTESKVLFATTLFHEMLHFKSYAAMQVTTTGSFTNYRVGLSAHSRDGEKMYLNNINEAVTVEMEQKFFKQLADYPLFKEDIQESNKLIRMFAPQSQGVHYAEVIKVADREGVKGHYHAYPTQREILNTLIDKLFSKNEAKFGSRTEVFDIFVKGMLQGNLLPLARLIDTTFGAGSFRTLAELDPDVEKQKEFVDSL